MHPSAQVPGNHHTRLYLHPATLAPFRHPVHFRICPPPHSIPLFRHPGRPRLRMDCSNGRMLSRPIAHCIHRKTLPSTPILTRQHCSTVYMRYWSNHKRRVVINPTRNSTSCPTFRMALPHLHPRRSLPWPALPVYLPPNLKVFSQGVYSRTQISSTIMPTMSACLR